MSQYAQKTTVPVSRSKAEIEDTLHRYGATGFMSGWSESKAMIAFQMHDREIKFILPMPDPASDEFCKSEKGKRRTVEAAHKAWEQGCRQRWRAMALCIKAKLEAVECGIVTFDQEFLAHIVTPNGQTVGQNIIPQIEAAKMPRLSLEA